VTTEYDNIALGPDGFIYAVTSTFAEWDLLQDKAKPIRKLNALGKDILVKNGLYPPIGDLSWSRVSAASGPSRLLDVTVLPDETYVALDQTRGRLFGYDSQGNLLFAFGDKGNMSGYFKKPAALEHVSTDLLVLDSVDGSLTVFGPTEYGALIYGALDDFQRGKYDASALKWRDTLTLNSNYALAYVGMGKAFLRQERYAEAMRYFRVAWDGKDYSRAFVLYRKEWVERHIAAILLAVALLLIAPLAIGRARKVVKEVREHDGTL
jgi:tetratricopeptide (TPR) repeat protein